MIHKELIAQVGAVTLVHVVTQLSIQAQGDQARAEVRSYASEESFINGNGNLDNTNIIIPLQGLADPIIDHVEAWLISSGESKFAGGTIIPHGPIGLAANKARKIAVLNSCCSQAIMNGFRCAALDGVHYYPAKKQDQDNLVASVTDSLIPNLPEDWTTPFWCMDINNVWGFRPHTATQIQQVGREAKMATLACMTKNEGLRMQVEAATTTAELETINW